MRASSRARLPSRGGMPMKFPLIERLEDGAKLTGTPLPDFVLDIVAQGGLLPKLAADGYLPVDLAMAGSGAAKGQAGGQV